MIKEKAKSFYEKTKAHIIKLLILLPIALGIGFALGVIAVFQIDTLSEYGSQWVALGAAIFAKPFVELMINLYNNLFDSQKKMNKLLIILFDIFKIVTVASLLVITTIKTITKWPEISDIIYNQLGLEALLLGILGLGVYVLITSAVIFVPSVFLIRSNLFPEANSATEESNHIKLYQSLSGNDKKEIDELIKIKLKLNKKNKE